MTTIPHPATQALLLDIPSYGTRAFHLLYLSHQPFLNVEDDNVCRLQMHSLRLPLLEGLAQ